MASYDEIIIDSLLCFLNSASTDFSEDALLDLAHCFYSHEMIKSSKTTLANHLHKDIIWRRDPEKKKKDLRDVMDFLKELSSAKKKIKFVCDSYKGMPPVGLEFIGPLIANLNNDVAKINDVLPKILDIKSEVKNTADAVTNLRTDVIDIKRKFYSAVEGIENATSDIADEDLSILNDLKTFRTSISTTQDMDGAAITNSTSGERDLMSYAESVLKTPRNESTIQVTSDNRQKDIGTPGIAADPATGAIPKKRTTTRLTNKLGDILASSNSSGENRILDEESLSPSHRTHTNDGWTLVSRKARKSLRNDEPNNNQKKSGFRLLGAKRNSQSTLRAVRRTLDVFLGRVIKDVEIDDIKDYIKENFNVVVQNVEPITIRSAEYNAFKVTVFSDERDKLFNADLWPEGMIVNKYYVRRVREL